MTTIITANDAPALPLLTRLSEDDDWPTYTGPLGVARLLVGQSPYHLVEVCQYGGKWGAFIANDPDAQSVMEFAVSYESEEIALRQALGCHFARIGYDSVSLGVALRHVLMQQLTDLGHSAPVS
jgi:hypothetical protein